MRKSCSRSDRRRKLVVQLVITRRGGVNMLADDAVDLRFLGPIHVRRASHVEFDFKKQKWMVRSAKTGKVLHRQATRAGALAWEKRYYSPSGKGWKELTEVS